MRKIILWASTTAAAVAMLFGYHTSTSGVAASEQQTFSATSTSNAGTTTSGTGPDTESDTTTDTSTDDTTDSSSGSSTDSASGSTPSGAASTYTGDTAQTRWGPVQVAVDVRNGTIEAVNILQYPSGNQKDVEINNYALPVLINQTLDNQSGSVDMVSGATVTSTGYVQSLQSALDQAGL